MTPLDAPTLSLIRRVLCAHAPPTQPLSALLPPLTHHHPAIDLQLYALLAIICRDYIDTWYTPLSSDREFPAELVRAAAAIATELERRTNTMDLPLLLLDALPALVARHITDHRLARARAGTVSHHTPAQLFHNLQPHPALAGGAVAAAHQYNKLLAHALLAALLPEEALPSPCARVFVRDLVAALAVGGVVERMSEPAMMYGLIASLLERPSSSSPSPSPSPSPATTAPPDPSPHHHNHKQPPSIRIPPTLESVLTAALLLLHTLKALAASLLLHHTAQPPPPPRAQKPFLSMAAASLLPIYVGLPVLQPWLWGLLCLLLRALAAPGRVGAAVDGVVRDAVVGALGAGGGGGVVVAEVLGRVRGLLFPGNAPMGAGGAGAGGVVDVEVVRGRAVDAIVEWVPGVVWGVWVGGEGEGEGVGERERRRRWVREWCVDVWADKEVNRHLWYAVLDLLVARLVPELVEGGEGEVEVEVEGQ